MVLDVDMSSVRAVSGLMAQRKQLLTRYLSECDNDQEDIMLRYNGERTTAEDMAKAKVGLTSVKLMIITMIVGAGGCGKTDSVAEKSAPTAKPGAQQSANPPPPPPSASSTETADPPLAASGIIAVATFKGDNLHECVEASVAIRLTDTDKAPITPHQAGLIIIEDILMLVSGGESVIANAKRAELTAFLTKIVEGKLDKKKRSDLQEMLSKLKWPFASVADRVKKGELAMVENCASVGRLSLGTCTLSDSTPSIEWSITRFHFDVGSTSDSDSGLKTCLRIGGNWSSPAKNDPAAARERMRQRAGELRRLLDEP